MEGLEFWLHGRLTDDLGASLPLHSRGEDIAASRFPAMLSLQQSCPVAQALFWRRAAAAELKNITVWLRKHNPRQLCLTASKLGLLPWRCQRPGLIAAKPCSVAQALLRRRQARTHPRQFCLTASKLGLLPWRCQRPGLRCRGFRVGHVLQCRGCDRCNNHVL